TQMLRAHGVVGTFVEFFGDGLSSLSVADRATLSNMCPEYGATSAYFPVDHETLRYLTFTGRGDLVDLVERYTKEQGLFRADGDGRGDSDVGRRRHREARLGRDRRDHLLYEHVQPVGDARRRPAREEGGGGGTRDALVGQDVTGTGLARRHRLPRQRGSDF